jgi:hypothetical protein
LIVLEDDFLSSRRNTINCAKLACMIFGSWVNSLSKSFSSSNP